jgi:hypothetical protein
MTRLWCAKAAPYESYFNVSCTEGKNQLCVKLRSVLWCQMLRLCSLLIISNVLARQYLCEVAQHNTVL